MDKHHKELIILDFDHTVFNTTAFVAALQSVFEEQFGIESETFMAKRQEIKECCFVIDIDRFVAALPSGDKAAMHDMILHVIRDHAATFVFDDVNSFIMRHIDRFDLLLITHGDKELQELKITNSKLPKINGAALPYDIVLEGKGEAIAPYIAQYDRVHFVDDKAENIDAVKGKFPDVIAYFIRRPEDSPYGGIAPVCECADQEISGLDFTIK